MRLGFLLLGFVLWAFPVSAVQAASADDNARFLAGIPLPPGSPLGPLADTPVWQQHASVFDSAFDKVDDRQLLKIRDWAKANIPSHQDTLFYTFSGPDFLYADAFFPDAKTYILAGLEPPGSIPDVTKLSKGAIPGVLRSLEISTKSLLNLSFFITARMRTELRTSPVYGTLPVIYIFMARTGKVIHDVKLFRLDADGNDQPEEGPLKKGMSQGAKITFSSPGGREQTLYYISTNVENPSFKAGGFSKFLDRFDGGDVFIKSASYLLHNAGFTLLRDVLMRKAKLILQDDTGIPVTQFGPQWELKTFGRYVAPIPVFSYRYQPKMADLFRKNERRSIDFGIGYRYRPNESSLLLAIKKEPAVATTAPAAAKNPETNPSIVGKAAH